MKKLPLILWTILILSLTACGTSNAANPASIPQSDVAAGELPVTTQLIIGTLKLEETNQAVTTEQAAQLLPLWQTLQVLSDSDTAAEQETEALITQIQETMTAEQMQAITDMNLTRADMMTVMQERGLGMGAGSGRGQATNTQNGTSSNNSGRNFGPGDGNMPPPDERGFPGGGPGSGAGGQGQNLSAAQIATAQAARQAGGGTTIPSALINALVQYLEEKAGS